MLNIDGFFQNSLVVAYTSVSLAPGELPVVITWSNTLRRYILAPLLPTTDGVSSEPSDSELEIAPSLRTAFRRVHWSGTTSALDGEAVDAFEGAGWLVGVKMLQLWPNSYFPIADDPSGLSRTQYSSYEYGALLSRLAGQLGSGLSCDQAYPRPPSPPPQNRNVLGHK